MNESLPVVDCFGCGVCCLHMGYAAFNLPAEVLLEGIPFAGDENSVAALDYQRWLAMPAELRDQLIETMKSYEGQPNELDGPCTWLDPKTRLCGLHEHRPQVCRDFEIGSSKCHEWREHYKALIDS